MFSGICRAGRIVGTRRQPEGLLHLATNEPKVHLLTPGYPAFIASCATALSLQQNHSSQTKNPIEIGIVFAAICVAAEKQSKHKTFLPWV